MLKKLLDRPISVTMLMLVVVVLGLVSIRLLPVSLIPDVDIPYVTVQVVSPGMSAREINESVVKVLRRQLIQVNGLEDIVCESRDGSGVVKLIFNHGLDMGYAFVEVNEKVDRAMSDLPEIERPKVLKSSATDIPAFYINITSEVSGYEAFSDMSHFARDVISKRLEQLSEVAMVDMTGYEQDRIVIHPNETKLEQLGITPSRFESLVNSANIRLGTLVIRDGQYSYNVKFVSSASSVEDIRNIWFRTGDKVLQIKDIADVEQEPAQKLGLVRSDGKPAICLAVIKQSDARMSELRKSLDNLITEFSEDYPQLEFKVTRDQTKLLEYSINNLFQNIVVGIILACLIIFLFMKDFRSPALVCLTMPVALIFSIAVFYIIGLTINIISLSGLLLGVGMLADNTIILVDNITSRWQRGERLRMAVIAGTHEVAGPMLSSVLTTCAVFIPLIFINGIAGELFFDQAVSVTIVLLTSYVVTITIIPVYYYWWYRSLNSFRTSPLLGRISFEIPFKRYDEKILNWFLEHKVVSWAVLGVSFIGIIVCFTLMPKDRLPEMSYTETVMTVDWNEQVSVEENQHRVASLENLIKNESLQITSMVGMQNFILGHSGDLGSSQASVYVNCGSMENLENVKGILSEFLPTYYPSAVFEFDAAGNIFDAVFADEESPLVARIRPASYPTLDVSGIRALITDIKSSLPDHYVEEPSVKKDVLFIADPVKMSLYNVSYQELLSMLKNSLNDNRLFTIVQGVRTIPVIMGTDARGLSDIISESFVVKDSLRIPVSELMKQTYVEDFKNMVSGAGGDYYPISLSGNVKELPSVKETVDNLVRAGGKYEVSFSGSWFSNKKMVDELLLVLFIAIILLYLILASQFESLVQPILILSEIAVDIFASLLVLWIMGLTINIMSMIGLIVISGIVINDSILKIDTINKLRKEGLGLRQAVILASGRRMKAIIMTSLTTILAVCPFLSRGSMGDDLQFPMSIVIIVGMTVGTFVSLFVLPALYYSVASIFDRKRNI